MSDPRQPQGPADEPEGPYLPRGPEPLFFEQFVGGLNTEPSRPGIAEDEMAWCDGFIPLGNRNLRTLPGVGDALFITPAPVPPACIVTWNPNDKSADILLSNGNLTATAGVDNVAMVRATNSITTGKFGFTAIHQLVNKAGSAIGIAGASASLTNYLGSDAFGWGLRPNGNLYNNGAVIATLNSYNLGDLITVVLDATAQLLWINVNGGLWNNNPSANPSTDTGGISVTGVTTYWPACSVS